MKWIQNTVDIMFLNDTSCFSLTVFFRKECLDCNLTCIVNFVTSVVKSNENNDWEERQKKWWAEKKSKYCIKHVIDKYNVNVLESSNIVQNI